MAQNNLPVTTTIPREDAQLLREHAERSGMTTCSLLRSVVLRVTDNLRAKHGPTTERPVSERRYGMSVLLPSSNAQEIRDAAAARGMTIGALVYAAVTHYDKTQPRGKGTKG